MARSNLCSCQQTLAQKTHHRQRSPAPDRQNVRSAKITSPTTPISDPPVMTTLPLHLKEPGVRTQMEYIQTVEFTGKISTDQTGRFLPPLPAVASTSWSCTTMTVTASWRNHSPLAANANSSEPLAYCTPTFPSAASPLSTKCSTMNAQAA